MILKMVEPAALLQSIPLLVTVITESHHGVYDSLKGVLNVFGGVM